MSSNLYFYHAPMNAGKSTRLLQMDYNYTSQGMKTIVLKSAVDTRDKKNKVNSRLGISKDAILITNQNIRDIYELIIKEKPNAVFVDECQFLSEDMITFFSKLVDHYNIPIHCFGLKSDYMGKMFCGSKALFEQADVIEELSAVCKCGKKATFVVLKDENGNIIKSGNQIHIGDSEFESVCRKHFFSYHD